MNTSSQNGQISTPERYYEIPTRSKEEPRTPIKETMDCYIETGLGYKA
jgi:hypothetical protein